MMARIASRPGKPWHLHVEQQNVGKQFECLGDGVIAVGRFANDFQGGFALASMLRTPMRTTG